MPLITQVIDRHLPRYDIITYMFPEIKVINLFKNIQFIGSAQAYIPV